jgi:hypothetical protein
VKWSQWTNSFSTESELVKNQQVLSKSIKKVPVHRGEKNSEKNSTTDLLRFSTFLRALFSKWLYFSLTLN